MTPMGGKLLTMLRNGPLQTMLTVGEMARLQEIQDSRQETVYHG
jgi:hypothetical protein